MINPLEIIKDEFEIDVDEMTVEDLKRIEHSALLYTSRMAYESVETTPIVGILRAVNLKLDEIDGIHTYVVNLQKIKDRLKSLSEFMNKYGKSVIEMKSQVGYGDANDNTAMYKNMQTMIDLLLPYFNVALKIDALGANQVTKEEYLYAIGKMNSKASGYLQDVVRYLKKNDDWAMCSHEEYEYIKDTFDSVTSQLAPKRKEAGKVLPAPINEKEQERLAMIKKANEMYDELCRDTMRDLQAQVPYSAREMYDYFVNVKFANFVKNFKMPLDGSTKIGTAKEACNQLNELFNYISKISENSHTTNVYGMKA